MNIFDSKRLTYTMKANKVAFYNRKNRKRPPMTEKVVRGQKDFLTIRTGLIDRLVQTATIPAIWRQALAHSRQILAQSRQCASLNFSQSMAHASQIWAHNSQICLEN